MSKQKDTESTKVDWRIIGETYLKLEALICTVPSVSIKPANFKDLGDEL